MSNLKGQLQVRYLPEGMWAWTKETKFLLCLILSLCVAWGVYEYNRTPTEKVVTVYQNNDKIVYREKEEPVTPKKLEKIVGIYTVP